MRATLDCGGTEWMLPSGVHSYGALSGVRPVCKRVGSASGQCARVVSRQWGARISLLAPPRIASYCSDGHHCREHLRRPENVHKIADSGERGVCGIEAVHVAAFLGSRRSIGDYVLQQQ